MNQTGHPQTLQAVQLGNRNAEQHGLYAGPGRELDPLAQEVADWLMQARHTEPLDLMAAIEIGKLAVLIDRVDTALGDGVVERKGQPRGLIDMRIRLSSRLEKWLRQFGLTPAARADFAKALAGGSFREKIEARRAALAQQQEAGDAPR
ncbi:hypothetical protein [Capillimicrobium parvum]|uniref:Uncharacterized protein n=1 Tax=Capillimicrobium parvum TaxID=2884022 RepID=A0A9E6XX38_9ACTN|nr:hypothetical protein [Capillimicrobium parvum]UGS36099.1 hypothetical protein DSM104329_02497 [Capillimicrobium parvum]